MYQGGVGSSRVRLTHKTTPRPYISLTPNSFATCSFLIRFAFLISLWRFIYLVKLDQRILFIDGAVMVIDCGTFQDIAQEWAKQTNNYVPGQLANPQRRITYTTSPHGVHRTSLARSHGLCWFHVEDSGAFLFQVAKSSDNDDNNSQTIQEL